MRLALSVRRRTGLPALVSLAVVEAAEDPPVLLHRETALGEGLDVVGLAAFRLLVAEGMRALLVADLEAAAGGPGEEAGPDAHLDPAPGSEHGPFVVGQFEPGHQ